MEPLTAHEQRTAKVSSLMSVVSHYNTSSNSLKFFHSRPLIPASLSPLGMLVLNLLKEEIPRWKPISYQRSSTFAHFNRFMAEASLTSERASYYKLDLPRHIPRMGKRDLTEDSKHRLNLIVHCFQHCNMARKFIEDSTNAYVT